MILQACLNGSRPADFHPRLPTTPEAIVADAVSAVDAGAQELHVHVRDGDGNETLAPDAVDHLMCRMRERLRGTFIGISTGAWIHNDDDQRLAFIEGWREFPDYASVNLLEDGAPGVFERLVRRGVGVEAGLASANDAERFARLGLASLTLRILIEVSEPDPAAAHAVADDILSVLAKTEIAKPVLLHGFDGTVRSFVERAARERLSTRIGLEDGKALPDDRRWIQCGACRDGCRDHGTSHLSTREADRGAAFRA
jgi:uncharacterized protein (DUF849 family)